MNRLTPTLRTTQLLRELPYGLPKINNQIYVYRGRRHKKPMYLLHLHDHNCMNSTSRELYLFSWVYLFSVETVSPSRLVLKTGKTISLIISQIGEKVFVYINKSTKENKLRQFSFRLLHRIITTKMELFKFRLVEDEACTLCLLPDSIEYTFLDCTVTTAFYSKAISWLNHENDTHITLSSKQVNFNDIPRLTHLTDYPRRWLHLFVIILKQHIYVCKVLAKRTRK